MTEDRGGSLAQGLRSLSQWRLVLLLTATTILLALLPAFALWPSLREVFSETLAGDHVLRNDPVFAPTDVLEFLYLKRDSVAGARQAAIAAALAGILVQVFYAGGFFETLARGRRVLLAEFFPAACRNLWHNLKCFVLFLVGLAVSLGIWLGGTSALAKKLFEEAPPATLSSFLFRIGTLLVGLLIFTLLSLLQDFARLARRHDSQIGAWRAGCAAWRLLGRSPFSAFGLFFFWLLAGGAFWLAILALEWGTSAVSVAAILLHTLLQVTAAGVRSAIRVGAWGSLAAFVDARTEAFGPDVALRSQEPPKAISDSEPLSPPDSLGETTLT